MSFDKWPDGVGEIITAHKRRTVCLVDIDLGEARSIEYLASRVVGDAVEPVYVAEQVQ
ncbi:hypothetical protein [Catenulispora sp. MAP5-51]|uniref:hypothetical protein n=1 Tax=Catenulispora sp. MAP5-51 TaxID=3156298 RepID=UPI003511CCFA